MSLKLHAFAVCCISDSLSSACRYYQSAVHNILVQRGGQRGSLLDVAGAELSGAIRCGLYAESNCMVTARECKFWRNGHYGVQTQPKASVEVDKCQFYLNRRGDCSGNGIVRK